MDGHSCEFIPPLVDPYGVDDLMAQLYEDAIARRVDGDDLAAIFDEMEI